MGVGGTEQGRDSLRFPFKEQKETGLKPLAPKLRKLPGEHPDFMHSLGYSTAAFQVSWYSTE